MGEYRPNAEQQAFHDDVARGSGNTVVSARAGVGKTASIVSVLRLVPDEEKGDTVLVAFNADIARELGRRAPRGVEVKTMHGLGYKACRKAFGASLSVEKERGQRIANEVSGADKDARLREWSYALKRTVSMCKGVMARSEAEVDRVVDQLSLEHPEEPREVRKCAACGHTRPSLEGYEDKVCGHAGCRGEMRVETYDPRPEFIRQVQVCMERAAYDMYQDDEGGEWRRGDPRTVDFDDQCYLPVALDLKMYKYLWVFCDECLPGPTPVLLADGSSRSIQELVESRYAGDVLSYDPVTKRQRACRVVGWQTVLNQKPLVKIKVRWTAYKKHATSQNKPTNFVICTVDHRVWANGSWVMAGDVEPGMLMQVETSAEKSQVGKITSRGRAVLATEVAAKNNRGVMGGKPPRGFSGERGGNGKGPTLPEQALMSELGVGWVYQHSIPTRVAKGTGFPTTYKVDLANVGCKVAVEVDGGSHQGRRALDAKKDKFLESLGWTVVRVPNRRAVQNAQEEARRILAITNCPIDAVVESVEPVTIPSFHVYDLTVEDLHCFYANGILVHNCQDLNKVQHALVTGSLARDGRFFAIGDPMQAIYRWRGACADSMEKLRREMNAKELPMTTTYRCGAAIVREAQRLVPDFKAADGQHEGQVEDNVTAERMRREAGPGDFVISRTNAPLMGLCLGFLREGRRAVIRGRDVGGKLSSLVRRSKAKTLAELAAWVREWAEKESAKLLSKGEGDEVVRDTEACLGALMEGASTPWDVTQNVARLFDDEDDAGRITLATTHRAKGMERDRVWLLRDTYRPQRGDEEKCLLYVGITRARHHLLYVRGALA